MREIRATLAGVRIHLRTPYSESLASKCKSIPGGSWSKTKGVWTYPLSMHVLRRLRAVFGEQLVATESLIAWAASERRREKQLKSLALVHNASLSHVPAISPTMAEAMKSRVYQRSAARFGARAESYVLADEPGLGKTMTSLAVLMERGIWAGSHIISAPKTSIDSTWAAQISHWAPDAAVFPMPEGATPRKKMWAAFSVSTAVTRIVVVNPAMLRRLYGQFCKHCDIWEEDVEKRKSTAPSKHYLDDHSYKRTIRSQDWPEIIDYPWTSIIVDEAHEIFASYFPSNISQTVQGLLDMKVEHKYALTGTPLRGREDKIWGYLNWMAPKEFGGYWSFIDNFFEMDQGFFGLSVGEVREDRRQELEMVLDRWVLRRTRIEVRPDLPKLARVPILLEMSNKHAKQYREFEEMGETLLASGSIGAQGMLSELTRLKQFAYGIWDADGTNIRPTHESPKLDYILEWLRARGVTGAKTTEWFPEEGAGYKYVIASQNTGILHSIAEALEKKKIKTLAIDGDVTGRARTAAVSKFQSEDKQYRVLLLNTFAGGVSIDLDAWCDEGIMLDETFIQDDQVQVEGRINNRSGAVRPRTWYYLRTKGTIEDKIAEENERQRDVQHKLLDGRRGVELALEILRGGD